jgi:chromosomal replication initiation ATPase DnaA
MDLSFIENYKRIRSDMQHRPSYDSLKVAEDAAKKLKAAAEEERRWEIKPSIANITRGVCLKHAMTLEEILSKDRSGLKIKARRELFWSIRTKLKWSYPKIGKRFGLNHTTILHSVRRYNEYLERLKRGSAK